MVRGTLRNGRTTGHEPVLPVEIPRCPAHLGREAKREWKRVSQELAGYGLLTRIDRAALALYCEAWGRWVEAEGALRKYGAMIKAPSGFPMQSPYLAMANKAMEQIRALTRGRYEGLGFRGLPIEGVDFAFDCIGHKVTMEQILAAARPGRFGVGQGGTAVLVGVPTTAMDLNVTELLMTEKSYIGSIGGSCTPDRDFPTFLQWHADGRLRLGDMVTERFALDEVNEAVDALSRGKISGRAIFVM